MRVAVVISSLRGGGAEKNAADLAERLGAHGHEPVLMTWEDADRDVYRPAVRRVVIGHGGPAPSVWRAMHGNIKRILTLRAVLREERPDVVVAFMGRTGISAVLAAQRLSIPVVVSERIDPREERLGRAWSVLRSYAYRRAAAIVPNSEEVAAWLAEWLPRARVTCIPNCVEVGESKAAVVKPDSPFVLTVGRLIQRKGHADLIRAFASCSEDWRLVILGEGPERNALQRLACAAGLRERVSLPGHTDPWPYLHACSIFAFPSYFEGFPNALLEAMAAGKPCVAYDCRSGPAELIRDGVNGYLVEVGDQEALRGRLTQLMDDAERRDVFAQQARRSAESYTPDRIYPRWETLLTAAARKGVPCTSRS